MITEVKERQVEVGTEKISNAFEATIRDGKVSQLDPINSLPDEDSLKAYIQFCQEVLEAIKQTK